MKSSFSSSSTSSSSMQSSSTKSSSTMGGIPGRGQDALLDMMGPGLDIEEMSNAGESEWIFNPEIPWSLFINENYSEV